MFSYSIEAYDWPERVASYDADMALMHPNRAKMVDIALQVLHFPENTPVRALDLGTGTGYFTARFLQKYAAVQVVTLDGAATSGRFATAFRGWL